MGSICLREKNNEEVYLGVQKRTATERQKAVKNSFSRQLQFPPQQPISKMIEKLDLSAMDKSASDGTMYYSCINDKDSRIMKDLLPESHTPPRSAVHLRTADSSSNNVTSSQENIPIDSTSVVVTEKEASKNQQILTSFGPITPKRQELKSGRQLDGMSIDNISDADEKFYEANEFFTGSPQLELDDREFNTFEKSFPIWQDPSAEELMLQKRRTAEFGNS